MSRLNSLGRENRFRFFYGCALISVVGAVLIVGSVQIMHLLWTSALLLSRGEASHLANWANLYLWSRPDGWLTAIATALLFWATRELTRLTRRQAAGASPVLRYTLATGGTASRGPAYPESWEAVDKNTPQLIPFTGGEPTYVDLRIMNQQSLPYGIAIGLSITVELRWGAVENVGYQPFRLERKVVIPVVGARDGAEGRVFNVGSIPSYVVRITNVTYMDMFKRIRHAAYGTGELSRTSTNLPEIAADTIFIPTKGEQS